MDRRSRLHKPDIVKSLASEWPMYSVQLWLQMQWRPCARSGGPSPYPCLLFTEHDDMQDPYTVLPCQMQRIIVQAGQDVEEKRDLQSFPGLAHVRWTSSSPKVRPVPWSAYSA